jgi:hypothetical protein
MKKPLQVLKCIYLQTVPALLSNTEEHSRFNKVKEDPSPQKQNCSQFSDPTQPVVSRHHYCYIITTPIFVHHHQNSMTVESFLTRELDIRFIDARNIVTEAKINLGVNGYPSKDQERELREEAIKIFQQRPGEAQTTMRRLSADLEAIKIPAGSKSSRASTTSNEEDAVSSICGSFASEEVSSRGRKMWPSRRR